MRLSGVFIMLFFTSINSEAKTSTSLSRNVLIQVDSEKVISLPDFKRLKEKYFLTQKHFYPSMKVFSFSSTRSEKIQDLCSEIVKLSGVINCELDLKIKPQNDLSCPSPNKGLNSLISLKQLTEENVCELVPSAPNEHKQKGLSPYWAQEYTGADLVREKLKASKYEYSPGLVGIWDTRAESHGVKVGNLISGPNNSSLIPGTETPPFSDLDSTSDYLGAYEILAVKCALEKNCPAYINNSMIWRRSKLIEQVVSNISNRSVFITAADNDSELVDDQKRNSAREDKAILVGSLSPTGFASDFTSFAPELTVSAPSDYHILSYDNDNKPSKFGGTSGAAPQVTAALAAFTLVTGYKLSTTEAKRILEKTAIKFPYYPTPNSLGVGMLNSYKIAEIAFRLKEKCKDKGSTCISSEVGRDESYVFKDISTKLLNESSNIFPECHGKKELSISKSMCDKRIKLFKEIRQAAFLNSENSELWKLVSCVNKTNGMNINADFFNALGMRSKKTDDALFSDLSKTKESRHLLKYFMSHPKWRAHGEWVEMYIKDPYNSNEIIKMLSLPEFADKSEWVEQALNSGYKLSAVLVSSSVLSKPYVKADPKIVELILSKNDSIADYYLAKDVLSDEKWLKYPELIEKLAAKKTANKEIEEYILSNSKWQKVLSQRYGIDKVSLHDLMPK
jgi:hypothetical protein